MQLLQSQVDRQDKALKVALQTRIAVEAMTEKGRSTNLINETIESLGEATTELNEPEVQRGVFGFLGKLISALLGNC